MARIGCAVAAQSALVVPADGALYALRDATATVPSIPLIAASVMSKKLAVLTDLILLDVKAGSGAFMKTAEEAERLARACLGLARGLERPARAAVTDMSQPLGDAIGNALDIVEAVEVLRGTHGGRLRELVVLFVAEALAATTRIDLETAVTRARACLDDGSALERFRLMVEAQGGDPRVVDDPEAILPRAPVIVPLLADRAGTLATTDAEAIGLASGTLGRRTRPEGRPDRPRGGYRVARQDRRPAGRRDADRGDPRPGRGRGTGGGAAHPRGADADGGTRRAAAARVQLARRGGR